MSKPIYTYGILENNARQRVGTKDPDFVGPWLINGETVSAAAWLQTNASGTGVHLTVTLMRAGERPVFAGRIMENTKRDGYRDPDMLGRLTWDGQTVTARAWIDRENRCLKISIEQKPRFGLEHHAEETAAAQKFPQPC